MVVITDSTEGLTFETSAMSTSVSDIFRKIGCSVFDAGIYGEMVRSDLDSVMTASECTEGRGTMAAIATGAFEPIATSE